MSSLHPLMLLYIGWCAGYLTAVIYVLVCEWRRESRRRGR